MKAYNIQGFKEQTIQLQHFAWLGLAANIERIEELSYIPVKKITGNKKYGKIPFTEDLNKVGP